MDKFGKFCPVCKNKNGSEDLICRYCGASLWEYPTSAAATTRNTGSLTNVPLKMGELPLEELVPPVGIAVYISGTAKPVFLSTEKEFIIGRKTEDGSTEHILDLSEIGGFNMGISRKHAAIRKTEDGGYEVIDLSSTNGTWLNDDRIIPNKPYPFVSGAQLRVGRMRFLVLYKPGSETKKKG